MALTAAVSGAGGLGSYGGYIMSPDELTALVAELKAATDRSFAVNLWVPHPEETDLRASAADVHRLRRAVRRGEVLTAVGLASGARG